MNNLAHAIRTLQHGVLSHTEFLEQVDNALKTDQANSARLLSEVLREERTRMILPPEVYGELQKRVKGLDEGKPQAGEDTRVLTGAEEYSLPQAQTLANSTGEFAEPQGERIKGVGDTLNGRFVLEECVGFGGMGTVYKALDLRKKEASDRSPYIAIKVLNVQFRGHPKSLIALQREAKKAQMLAHPNIVTVYDFDRDGPVVYLTMEFLSGKPLSQMLRAPDFKGLPYAQAMPIISGIGKALSYAHERGFVHCDLKPANVFLTDTGDVKVIDFGIARVFHKPEQDAEATVFDAGSLGGLTPAYASPEMLEHLEPDPRDDIYALACITYELLTGKHPFERVTALQARSAGMHPQRPKNLGFRQWRALKCALCFDRQTRTPSVARFVQDMSGEMHAKRYLVPAAASVVIGVSLAAVLVHYWRSPGSTEPSVEATQDKAPPVVVSQAPEPAAKESAPDMPATPSPAAPAAPTPAAPSFSQPPPAAVPKLSAAAVEPVLAGVPCSALLPTVHGDAVSVQGFMPKSFGTARLQEMLKVVPGARSVELDVRQVGDNECDLISALAPHWLRSRQAKHGASVRARGGAVLTEGDPLVVDIKTPGYDSFVYVDYYVLDGHVAHLVPNERARSHQAPPDYSATIGSAGNWVVAKPFGTELIVLTTTPVPIFEGLRPDIESHAEYVRAIDKQLKQIAAKHGTDRIMVDLVQITTKAKGTP